MAESTFLGLVAIFALAVTFDYINGFHDTANAIATSVTTRALKPEQAIMLSATSNFLGAIVFGTAVASTIGSGIVQDNMILANGAMVLAGALLGAISWNLITWALAIPSSSSHALVGGLIGAADAADADSRASGPGDQPAAFEQAATVTTMARVIAESPRGRG